MRLARPGGPEVGSGAPDWVGRPELGRPARLVAGRLGATSRPDRFFIRTPIWAIHICFSISSSRPFHWSSPFWHLKTYRAGRPSCGRAARLEVGRPGRRLTGQADGLAWPWSCSGVSWPLRSLPSLARPRPSLAKA